MSYLEAFTIFEAAAVSVRVEPPDVVCIDEPGRATRRVLRSQIARCEPMLVSVYRQRHPGALPGVDEGLIVIEFQVTGEASEVLGPYPWGDGIKAGDAIRSALGNLVFAAPGVSLVISHDGSEIVFTCSNAAGLAAYAAMGLSVGSVSTPVPTAYLEGVALCLDPDLGARVLATGRPGNQYVALEMSIGKPWLVGPFTAPEAGIVAQGIRAWRREHPRDAEPVEVTEAQLLAEPTRWHGRRIRVEGTWDYQFESSSFAGVWLSVPDSALRGSVHQRRSLRVRVVGTWYYAPSGRGYGHMGGSPGELKADSMELL